MSTLYQQQQRSFIMSSFYNKSSKDDVLKNLNVLIDDLCRSGGSVNSNVEFQYDDIEGIGIFSKADITKGSVIVNVPYKKCISVESLMRNDIMRSIITDNPGLLDYPDEILAIGLMYSYKFIDVDINDDIESQCEWIKHVKTLPRTFNTTLYWSESELDELKYNNVFHLTKLMKNQMKNDWQGLHLSLVDQYPEFLSHATLELYMWALTVVYSRAVGIQRHNKYDRIIPPVLDMANHSPNAGTEAADTLVFDTQSDELRLVSFSDVETKDECFAVYGVYPNAKLAFTYGFVALNNPHRAIDVWTKVTPTSYEAQRKQEILQSNELTYNQTYDFVGTIRDNYISPALLATIRIIQINDVEELSKAANAFKGQIISTRNEAATYASLKNLILAKMHVEQAESDKKKLGEMLLDGVNLDNRLLIAIIIRSEERELYSSILALVDTLNLKLESEGDLYIPPDSPDF